MAIVKCAECGNDVSTNAAACPKCGALGSKGPAVAQATAARRKLTFYVVSAIIAVLGIAMCTAQEKGRVPQPREPSLNAGVAFSGGAFVIKNNDSYDWKDCDFELNSDYAVKINHIAPHGSVELTPGRFAKADGTRFNLRNTRPMQMYIHCRRAPEDSRSTLVGWK